MSSAAATSRGGAVHAPCRRAVRHLVGRLPRRPCRIRPPVRGIKRALAVAALFLGAALPAPARQVETVDLMGNRIVLEAPAQRIIIDDSRYLVALSLIHPDPVGLIAAWAGDTDRIGEELYAAYARRFPAIRDLGRVARSGTGFSVEQALAAGADLAVFSLQSRPSADAVAQLQAAGTEVAVIDFFDAPLKNLAPSLRILGDLIDRRAAADAFIAYRARRLDIIRERVGAASGPRPVVFLEPHAARTDECCASPGRGNIGDYIDLVGGRNIGDILPGSRGMLNLEYVISTDPAVYIATGGVQMEGTAGLLIGPAFDDALARETLAGVVRRPGISGLRAVREGHVHGIAHQILNSPLDILTTELLAKWIRPDLFADLDPERTREEVNDRFLAVPLIGTYWIDLAE